MQKTSILKIYRCEIHDVTKVQSTIAGNEDDNDEIGIFLSTRIAVKTKLKRYQNKIPINHICNNVIVYIPICFLKMLIKPHHQKQ